MFPQRLARARFNLDNSGYVLQLATNALRVTGHTAAPPQLPGPPAAPARASMGSP